MRSRSPISIRLLTHNVRYATNSPFVGEEVWEVRKPRIINELRFTTAHCGESFICLQEVLYHQLTDILAGLNCEEKGEWDYVGVGRDNGIFAGEFSPILFRPSVWDLVTMDTLWLSPTPEVPSKGWDAACNRILTVAIFRHHRSEKKLVAMNTHLDHRGPNSRLEAANIILEQIGERGNHGQLPVFLAGDFNSQSNDAAYLKLTNKDSPMEDLYTLSPSEKRYGHYYTFTGFGNEEPTRIDFVFTDQKAHPWLVQNYAVLENKFDDGVYASDHRTVSADVVMP
ncbi:MAG: hypothetical protein Q9211_000688 [Gyalolechia sp. 1 TL-2023]